MANIGYLFYKKYFETENGNMGFNENAHDKILRFINTAVFNELEILNAHCFSLTTIYPGLLIGSGYIHTTSDDSTFKLGFFFDYTTGQPIIPGSSVKGLLRSVFPSYNNEGKSDKNYYIEKEEYIKNILQSIDSNLSSVDIKKLEKDIFEGIYYDNVGNEINRSMTKRDIFFDAYITSTNCEFFGEDYITPHKHRSNPDLDEFANPTPIKFLKILPGITFKFQFDLKDSYIGDVNIAPATKLALFKQIILDMGIGAKTNVGFGKFKE